MRIAEINDIASVASELADGLRARGHTVDVIRPRLVGGKLPWMVKPIVGPVRAAEWAQIIRQVQAGAFDMVHIHYAYLGMLGVLGNFDYIAHCHGSDIREITPFTRPLIERSLENASHVFYATPDLAGYVLSRRPDAQFLPNPVDSDQFIPTTPAVERDGVFIACGLTEIKGAPRLLDACRKLAACRPDIRVTAIAGGPYTMDFRALPNVTLIPHMTRSHFRETINAHGVVIGQARVGAIGMAELESMSCARPLVAWFRHDRAYAEPPPMVRAVDGADIAAAVIRLHDDLGERESLGNASRTWVQHMHNLDGAAARVEGAAEAILAER